MAKFIRKSLGFIIKFALSLVLPFIVLIRGSVFFHEHYQFGPYFSLLLGAGITFIVLLIYFVVIYGQIAGRKRLTKKSMKVKTIMVSLLLLSYMGYTLFYLSSTNAKTTEVQKEFTALHPIVRVSVGTIVLLDQDMIITDMSRGKEDYKKMGLKTLKNSLHYPQKDGYVHAMDLRTNGRSEFRNDLLKFYFDAMGFHTLRHVGTGDHLHISLSIHENPNAI